MDSPICANCGSTLDGQAQFCPMCGARRTPSSAGAATQRISMPSSAGQPTQRIAPPSSPSTATPPPLSPQARVTQTVQRYSTFFLDDSVFYAPQIPHHKLENAVETYAPMDSEELALFLLDDSLLGSAKDGLLLTDSHLYGRRDPFSQPQQFDLARIVSVQARKESGTWTLFINGNDFIYLHFGDNQKPVQLAEMLQEAARAFNASADPIDDKVLGALLIIYQAGLLSLTEYQKKKRQWEDRA